MVNNTYIVEVIHIAGKGRVINITLIIFSGKAPF